MHVSRDKSEDKEIKPHFHSAKANCYLKDFLLGQAQHDEKFTRLVRVSKVILLLKVLKLERSLHLSLQVMVNCPAMAIVNCSFVCIYNIQYSAIELT